MRVKRLCARCDEPTWDKRCPDCREREFGLCEGCHRDGPCRAEDADEGYLENGVRSIEEREP
jgi:hypothetical protein